MSEENLVHGPFIVVAELEKGLKLEELETDSGSDV
jgi:hypothetical protein